MKKQLWDGLGRFSYDNRWLIPGLAIASSVAQFMLAKLIVAISFVAGLSIILFVSALWSVSKQSKSIRPEIEDGEMGAERGGDVNVGTSAEDIDGPNPDEALDAPSITESADHVTAVDGGDDQYLETSAKFAADGDFESLKAVYDSEMAKATSEDERNKKRAWFELAIVHAGNLDGVSESLENLKKMVDDKLAPQEEILSYYADALSVLGETDKAIEILLKNSESFSLNDRASALLNAARFYARSDRYDEGMALLVPILHNPDADDVLRGRAWDYVGDGIKARTPFRAMASYERALNLSPANTDARFSLAYLYSHHNLQLLARYHYGVLLTANLASATAKNNLGAALVALGMPGRGFSNYYFAAEAGSAIAWANMAHTLIDAGDLERAKECIEKGNLLGDSEERLISAKERLETAIRTESEKAERLTKEAVLLRAVVSDAVEAPTANLSEMSGRWKLNGEREMTLVPKDGSLVGIDGEQEYKITLVLNEDELTVRLRPGKTAASLNGFAYCKDEHVVLIFPTASDSAQRVMRLSQIEPSLRSIQRTPAGEARAI